MRHAWNRISVVISLIAILLYVSLRYLFHSTGSILTLPLSIAIITGGLPLLYDLFRQVLKREFGSDFLAGLSIVTATLMGELLVATIIVLMLTGGQTLEEFATRRASSVLIALARRMSSIAHRIAGDTTNDIPVSDIRIGDRLVVFPHEICPVDGTVESGTGTMDKSFLTGEPFRVRKISGSQVISGALNEDSALFIVADRLAIDSRYARIMQVMQTAEQKSSQNSPPRRPFRRSLYADRNRHCSGGMAAERRSSSKSPHEFADRLVFYPEASPFHGEYNLVLSICRDDDKYSGFRRLIVDVLGCTD